MIYQSRERKDYIDLIFEAQWLGGMTRKEVAFLIGVHEQTLCQWLNKTHDPSDDSKRSIRRVHKHLFERARTILATEYKGYDKKANKLG